jgi:hypothetical protein
MSLRQLTFPGFLSIVLEKECLTELPKDAYVHIEITHGYEISEFVAILLKETKLNNQHESDP